MCAIVGSFSRDKLIELIELNSYRGSHSFSYSTIDDNGLDIHKKDLGAIDYNRIGKNNHYKIVHIQAPTTDSKWEDSIHPAQQTSIAETALWHNGIIKANYVKEMQKVFGEDTNWDTELLLRAINYSTTMLSKVDGSFSCLWWDGLNANLFRNDISPMFYDGDLNISSTKFEGSISTPANKILRMEFAQKALYNTGEFKTVENPYYFGDDI